MKRQLFHILNYKIIILMIILIAVVYAFKLDFAFGLLVMPLMIISMFFTIYSLITRKVKILRGILALTLLICLGVGYFMLETTLLDLADYGRTLPEYMILLASILSIASWYVPAVIVFWNEDEKYEK